MTTFEYIQYKENKVQYKSKIFTQVNKNNDNNDNTPTPPPQKEPKVPLTDDGKKLDEMVNINFQQQVIDLSKKESQEITDGE